MAEALERVRRKRGVIRAATTRLLTRIEEEVSKDQPNCDKLREILSVLSVKEEILIDLDKGIEDETPTQELEAEIEVALEYRERIIICKTRANRHIQKDRDAESVRVSNASAISNLSLNKQTVRLPKLEIAKFDGEISQWQEFWSQFDTAIHSNETLCKSEKFSYLKSYLTGAAAKAVTGLNITDGNYDTAIKLLHERFGRKDVVVTAHMSKLLNLTPVKRSSDVAALRKLYDECEIQIRSLECLGVSSDTYGCLLCPVLLQLIPDELALAYTRKSDNDGEWNVLELIRFLQNEVQSRERALQLTRPGHIQRDQAQSNKMLTRTAFFSGHQPKKWSTPSAAALHTASNHQTCVYCESPDHKPEHCPDNSLTARKEKLRKLGRCFVCLGPKHIAKFCRVKGASCALCKRRHHQSICDQVQQQLDTSGDGTDAVVSSVSSIVKLKPDGHNTILLQTVKVWTEGPSGKRIIRCLLDGGSQRSFIHESVVKALKLPVVRQETLHLHTFGSAVAETTKRNVVKVLLESMWDTQQRLEIEAVETPQVCAAVIRVPGKHIQEECKRKGLQLADFLLDGGDNPELSLLIGADFYWQVVSGKVERITGSLVAVESSFGWTVQGPVSSSSVAEVACMHISLEEDMQISKQMHAFWEIESLGIVDKKTQSPDDIEALQSFEKSIKFKDGRYQVELPWRPDKPDVPDNFGIAKRRFEGLQRRLKHNAALFARYDDVIQDYLQQGMCEDVPENSPAKEQQVETVKYYLPHHAVLREDKVTTKLRIVFDASSHVEGCPSLNDCLLTGPNLNPNLLDVLIKFRLHQIAFTADITKAFLQISLAEKDRDAVRFLWLHEHSGGQGEEQLRIMRMSRVVFGVSSSPFLLAATIRTHIKQYEAEQPKTVEALTDSLYVDDFIGSSSEVKEAYFITKTAKEILSHASMNLCKWVTNSPVLKAKWAESEMECTAEMDNSTGVLKVLGLVWRAEGDELAFDLKAVLNTLRYKGDTKRSVLKTSARIFDPIGFLTPYTMRVKCLFQDLWVRGIGWDEQLPPDLTKVWNQWCAELPRLHLLAIPRWYQIVVQQNSRENQLHIFCDASERAYGVVAYLQGKNKDGQTVTSFVASKARVAPLKRMTLPRLELMGALIGARLGNNLLKSLNMERNQLKLWTDSMIVLHWVRGTAQKWKPFVENRVTEIQNLTNPESWSHCSGNANPADLPTRGLSVENLIQNQLWWNGPTFQSSTNDTQGIDENCIPEEANTELRAKYQAAVCLTNAEQVEPLLNLDKYSRLRKVLRITAWVKRFLGNACSSQRVTGELTTEEITSAEVYWIKVTQGHSFCQEISQLSTGQDIKGDSKIKDLKPFLDENGLISVGGRLQQSKFSFRERHPWVLPTNHRYSELVVLDCHERIMHAGVRDTLVQVRDRYWILKGRQLIKRIIGHCCICKRLKIKPAQQVTAPLPKDRVTESPPFEVTGLDFAGPLYVKTNGHPKKAYIALFTCAVTRAVHLELVSDQTTENFLLTLRRFIARRGLCKVVYSDNAKTFKRASKDLKELWKSFKVSELTEFFTEKSIIWKFIVERAAWWGGFWERLVRSVKECLKRVLGKALLDFEELTTMLAEIEAVLNSRPLSYVHDDASEPQPLTPSHFLIGKRLTSLPPKTTFPPSQAASLNREDMCRRWRYRQRLLNQFWTRWRKDYLMDLKSAHKCKTPRPTALKVGDVVVIGEDNMPRQTWKMGRITELFPGRDGLIRSCLVRTSSGSVLRRPVQLIYPLEIV